MARIQLRDTSIFIQDGLAGTAGVDVGNSALAAVPVTRTAAGSTGVDEVQVIAQFARAPSGGTYSLYIDDGTTPVTIAGLDYDDTDAEIETAIDLA